MAVILRKAFSRTLTDAELLRWSDIPTTIISDEMNRCAGMGAHIAPISTASAFVGEAVTVGVMAGDNLALHIVVNRAPAGSVLVVSAGGYRQTAVWGEILHTAAQIRGIAAVIIDGVIRDRAALRKSPVPVFARGACPNGPHKGWGGTINGHIDCGGVSVGPGDLVVGDEDGIVVVPQPQLSGLHARCKLRIEKERVMLQKIREGIPTTVLLDFNAAIQDETHDV
jgi:4-hydroxy-4-methyl-2-oxoglutarate aldolase